MSSGVHRRRGPVVLVLGTAAVVVALVATVLWPRVSPGPTPSPTSPTANGSPTAIVGTPSTPPPPSHPPPPTPIPGATDDQPLPDCPPGVVPRRDPPTEPEPPGSGPVELEVVAQLGGPPASVLLGERSFVGVGGRLAEVDPLDRDVDAVAMSAPIAERLTAIAPAGAQLAVALGRDGLALVDAATLDITATLELPGYAESVAVDGALAYVADGPGGLRLVDLNDPAQPVEIGRALELHRVMDVGIAGGRAYLAAADEGLIVLDVSDPTQPAEIGRLFTGGYAFAIDLAGEGRVLLADGWNGLRLVDVADPTAPAELAALATTGWAMDVAVEGERAAVAAGNELVVVGGLRAGRLDEPVRLVLPAGRAHAVDLAGDLVALADETAGVALYDIGAGEPVKTGTFSPLARASGLTLDGDRAFVAALGQGLREIDVSDPAAPVEQPPIVTADLVNAAAVVDGRVLFTSVPRMGSPYVGSLYRADAPGQAVAMNVPHGIWLDADGSILFAAAEGELLLVDAASEAPCLLGRLRTTEFGRDEGFEANGISLAGDTAFVAGYFDDIHVVDVSDPRQPRLVEAVPSMGGVGVGRLLAVGDTLYTIAADDDGPLMAVFDVSDRARPRIQGRVRLLADTARADESGPPLAYGAGYLFVADGLAGLLVIDVSDPAKPVIAGELSLPGDAVGVAIADEHAYVVTDGGAFFVVGISPAAGVASAPPSAARLTVLAAQHQAAADCLVTSAADEGPGTLRDCLAGAGTGARVSFDASVFPAAQPATIDLHSSLAVPSGTLVDGTGAGVIVDGGGRVPTGLELDSESTLRGLIVTGFTEAGVVLDGSGNLLERNVVSDNGQQGVLVAGPGNRLLGNLVGLDPTGSELFGRQSIGVSVGSETDNIIGGPAPDDRNVIAGRLAIYLKQARGVLIEGNYIGTDISGTRVLAEGEDGAIVALDVASSNNRVVGNVVAGTVRMIDPGSSYNSIVGNRIGVGADGRPLPVGGGVSVDEPLNRIGGTLPGEGNIVNGGFDITAANTIVLGNLLGVGADGTPSGEGGIRTTRPRTIIGGASTGAGNVLATFGVTLFSPDNVVIGNELLAVESSDLAGVRVAAGSGNLIVGNRLATAVGIGVLVDEAAHSTLVVGNLFDLNGTAARDDGEDTAWDDGRSGNFWSDFRAPDADGDGILDRPREVPPAGADGFPLAEPPERWRR